MIAHISGVPVEELLPLAYGAWAMWGAALAVTSKLAARAALGRASREGEQHVREEGESPGEENREH